MLLLPDSLTLREARDAMRLLKLALESEAEPRLVIDGSQLRRFDSSALAVLLECRRLAQAWGKQFELRALPPKLGELAKLYGIDALLLPNDLPNGLPDGSLNGSLGAPSV